VNDESGNVGESGYPGIYLEGLRKTTNRLSFPCRDSNQVSPENESNELSICQPVPLMCTVNVNEGVYEKARDKPMSWFRVLIHGTAVPRSRTDCLNR